MTRMDGSSLEGVSTTALWTLRSRALESRRPRGLIKDPWAEHIYDSIAFDYGVFGAPKQFHVLRALSFDRYTRQFLQKHPNGSVVALAEGFQTSFWRLTADGQFKDARWYSIDLEPVMALREKLLPGDSRLVNLAASALDRNWMDSVDDGPVLITAEGLLMYLPPAEALGLIADCAQRFPGAQMIFDSVPHRYSRQSLRGLKLSARYRVPPMPFSLSAEQANDLSAEVRGVRSVNTMSLPAGRGLWRLCGYRILDRFEPFRSMGPAILTFDA
ncbi:class I SAM-dependent methyltransferase [Mycobacterium sp. 48b]|uniref:class I SAM-dependent methyltransferase n=1 Tax=Mycobacterium sp. 48b TaxID=3400426 RepID=UPI003AAD74EC